MLVLLGFVQIYTRSVSICSVPVITQMDGWYLSAILTAPFFLRLTRFCFLLQCYTNAESNCVKVFLDYICLLPKPILFMVDLYVL